MVERVATKVWMRSLVMMSPFTAPSTAPTSRATPTAPKAPSCGTSFPSTQVVSARMEPMERSNPPAVMAKVIPAAAMATVAALVSRLTTLAPLRMFGVSAAKTARVAAVTR